MDIYQPGTLIDDKYEVTSQPMIGGMGVVYFCLDHNNDKRPVVLKTFKPEFLSEFSVRDRFLREASIWVDLNEHPHIVRCYQVMSSGINTFLVLELVSAEMGYKDASLRSRLFSNKPLSYAQALSFAIQIARGLQYASSIISGFVHRDLKPENILVGADYLPNWSFNRLRVTDFGLSSFDERLNTISKDLRNSQNPQNDNNDVYDKVVGTPLYMAPEQWLGLKLGTYTDIYALGCILAEMLTGAPLTDEKTIVKLRNQHCSGNLRPLPDNLPECLVDFISNCLSLYTEKRFQNWESALENLCNVFLELTGLSVPEIPTQKMLDSEEELNNARSYSRIGFSYRALGKYEEAREYYERALNIGNLQSNEKLQMSELTNLGVVYERLGEYRTAIEYLEKALKIARKNKDEDKIAEIAILGTMGLVYEDLGQHERAIKLHEQQLEYARANGDLLLQSYALGNLGLAHDSLGQFQQAIECYTQSIELKRERGDRYGEANSLGNLGIVYCKLGQFENAIELHEQQLEIARALGDEPGKSSALYNLGICYIELGQLNKAIDYWEQCLYVVRTIGNKNVEFDVLGSLGEGYSALGKHQDAIKYYEDYLELTRVIGDQLNEAKALGDLGNENNILEQYRKAKELYEQSIEVALRINNKNIEANSLEGLGAVYLKMGQHSQSIEKLEQSLEIRHDNNDIEGEIRLSFNLAIAYALNGETARAISLAQQINKFYISGGMTEKAEEVQNLLGMLQGDNSPSPSDEDLIKQSANEALEAFLNAASLEEMRNAVNAHSLIVSDVFVHDVKRFIAERATPERRPVLEQKLKWVERIEIEVLLETALMAFQAAESYDEMINIAKQYPVILDVGFIQIIENVISNEDDSENELLLEERLDWLIQVTENEQ